MISLDLQLTTEQKNIEICTGFRAGTDAGYD